MWSTDYKKPEGSFGLALTHTRAAVPKSHKFPAHGQRLVFSCNTKEKKCPFKVILEQGILDADSLRSVWVVVGCTAESHNHTTVSTYFDSLLDHRTRVIPEYAFEIGASAHRAGFRPSLVFHMMERQCLDR